MQPIGQRHAAEGVEKRFNYRLTLFTFTSFNWIYDSFYTIENGVAKKKVPFFIDEYITPLGLAHLVMHTGVKENEVLTLYFRETNFINISEFNLIKEALLNKYNIESDIRLNRKGYESKISIIIKNSSFLNLSKIIAPHMPLEFSFLLNKDSLSSLLKPNKNISDKIASESIYPIKIYENADICKDLIIKDNADKSGIYRWTHIYNLKSYLGSSSNLKKRFSNYYNYNYISDPKKNMLINKALLNNGYSVFRLEILEYCDKELLIDREQFYLDLLKPEYNILEFAYYSIGSLAFDQSRAKVKHSASTLKKFKDRILTPEQKFKLKKHLNELNSKQFTDEFRYKLSKGTANFNRLSKGKKVNFTNIETDTKLEFFS